MPEQDSTYYDRLFRFSLGYNALSFRLAPWAGIWRYGLMWLLELNPHCVVDLGCGPGHFSHMLSAATQKGRGDSHLQRYIGYDFSPLAIAKAEKRVKDSRFEFHEADLKEKDYVAGTPDDTVYVSFEFLEHIEPDREIVARIPSGHWFICSVPSFDDPGHVRTFSSAEHVMQRYGELFEFTRHKTLNHAIWSFITRKQWDRFIVMGKRR